MKEILVLLLFMASASVFGCSDSASPADQLKNPEDTPTEAYKRLFAAVKSKNTGDIRHEMSAKTQEFAKAVAAKQNKTEEEVLSNGFTATTFSPTLPEIRDERVKDKMGAIEVWNSTDNRWEDLPFVREADGWKLAVGDLFANTYQSPGKGLSLKEREASNTSTGTNGMQMAPLPPGADGSVNSVTNRPANANANRK